MSNKVTVLGINGHIGRYAARAFAAAGWEVTGFGRSNRFPDARVRFVAGDADSVADLNTAIGASDVVVNALNLPYDKWDQGRMEAQTARVIEAMGKSGKTMLFPGNIYNFGHQNRLVTPDLPQEPPTARGAIRVRVEQQLRAAAERGDMQVIVLRAGDFYSADCGDDWFSLAMLREAGKGKLAVLGAPGVGHSWAYLPDLAKAFEKLAWHRKEMGRLETFHFAGHFRTPEQLAAAVTAAAPVPLKVSRFPWMIMSVLGLTNPVMREVAKMGYLWTRPMELRDERLDAILGPDSGTPFEAAVAATVGPIFDRARQAA